MNFKVNYKKVFLIFGFAIFIGSAVFIRRAFSYDTNFAHPLLTKKAIEEFNKTSGNKISEKEINWIVQGAKEEDTPIRWMNHFYDPVNNKGLLTFSTAKEWSEANIKQLGYLTGNQTWKKALGLYQEGKKQESFIALGHILHLIEDMAVPAHTRDDSHAEGDPYEDWVKNNSEQGFDKINIIHLDNLDKYFDTLANYSNKYFLSEDTINEKELADKKIFNKNLQSGETIKCVEGNANGTPFCLIKYKINKIGEVDYILDDSPIHSDYYSLLAPRAVATSAGVIELFLKEAGKEVKKELLN